MRRVTLVKSYAGPEQFLQHVMGNGPGSDMFDDDFHLRVVREAAILLIESEMSGMKMYYERRRTF